MNFTSLLQDGIYEVGNGAIVTDQSPYLGITPDYQGAYGFPTHPVSYTHLTLPTILLV